MVDYQSRETRRDEDTSEDSDSGNEQTDESGTQETTQEPAETPDESGYAVVTVANDRTLAEDEPGEAVVSAIERAGKRVVWRELIQPSYDGVQSTLSRLVQRGDIEFVVTIGGTGVEPDDVTVDAIDQLFDKRLPGFGELFRVLAYEKHGTAVIGTRTTAGIFAGVPVFALPGTTDYAGMGAEEIVLQEAASLREAAHNEQ